MKCIPIFFFLLALSSTTFISCSKEYSLETGSSRDTASGSLHDSTGNCFTSIVNGTYTAGVANGSTNYVEIQVNVTKPGSYVIESPIVNGFSLKDSGSFTATGLQTVRLMAIGTPVSPGATDFVVSFRTTSCVISINVQGTGGPNPPGNSINGVDTAWTFTEAGKTYHGYIDTAYTYDTLVFGQNFRILQLQGSTATTGDSVFLMNIIFAGTVKTGTYTTNAPTNNNLATFQFLGSYNLNDTLYSATFEIPTVNTTVNVTSFDASTQVLRGNFSGTAKNKTNGTVNLTSGRFQAKLN
jgi:hypothetical protein